MTDKPDFLSLGKALVESAELVLPKFNKGKDMTIVIKGLTSRETKALSRECQKPTPKGRKGKADEIEIDNDKLMTLMVARSAFNMDGERLVADGRETELDDFPQAIMTLLQNKVTSFNGWGGDDAKNP